MGHTSIDESAPGPLFCAPTLIISPRPCPRSVRLLLPPVAGTDTDDDPIETVLSDRGGNGLAARGEGDACGGANPLPLPRMRPPPSLRPDIVAALSPSRRDDARVCVDGLSSARSIPSAERGMCERKEKEKVDTVANSLDETTGPGRTAPRAAGRIGIGWWWRQSKGPGLSVRKAGSARSRRVGGGGSCRGA